MKKVKFEFVTFTNNEEEACLIVESIIEKFGGDIAGGCSWSICEPDDNFEYKYTEGNMVYTGRLIKNEKDIL